jgi:hypothetical protein
MPDMPTGALVQLYRIERRMSAVSLATHAGIAVHYLEMIEAEREKGSTWRPAGAWDPPNGSIWRVSALRDTSGSVGTAGEGMGVVLAQQLAASTARLSGGTPPGIHLMIAETEA